MNDEGRVDMSKTIAIMTDIHGNSSALKAVLEDIDAAGNVDHIYCLGDMIAIGHETNEVLELLLSRSDISYVKGNHEEAVLLCKLGRDARSHGEEREHHLWIAAHKDEQYISYLQDLPFSIEETINGTKILFVHYHLDEDNDWLDIEFSPSAVKLDDLYIGSDIDVVCFGHHHILHEFKGNHRLYFNPGALGCHSKPIATYGLIHIYDDGTTDRTVKEISYNNEQFLLQYYEKQVPAKEIVLKVFHGNQDKELLERVNPGDFC